MDRVAVDEMVVLKAEVASLKLQNENLEIRLAAANDKILEVTKDSLHSALQSQWLLKNMRDHHQGEAEKFRKELMRRGADDPRKPKPECDTAFAALQVVCNRWDRDDCVADLKKQRAEHLRRIDALRSGRELTMDAVAKAMNEDNGNLRMVEDYQASLHHVLSEMREQLCVIYETLDPESAHEEWFKYPLSMFMSIADSENSDMEDDESMESE
jgi:hypothetical protein